MAERDDDEAEAYEEKPRRKPARDEGIQPPKPRPAEREDDDWDEEEDDRPRRRRSRRPDVRRDDDGVSTIIPYKNGMALAAYYVGVFSLIPCLALILGPLGIIFGIVGLRRVNANPEVKGTGHAIAGLVLGGLTLLVNVAVIILIVVGAFSRR